MHLRADMGSRERADMDLESRVISARVIKQTVNILVKNVTMLFKTNMMNIT